MSFSKHRARDRRWELFSRIRSSGSNLNNLKYYERNFYIVSNPMKDLRRLIKDNWVYLERVGRAPKGKGKFGKWGGRSSTVIRPTTHTEDEP